MTSPSQDTPTSSPRRSSARRDLAIILIASVAVLLLGLVSGLSERLIWSVTGHDASGLGELFGFLTSLSVGLGIFSFRRWRELQRAEQLRLDDLRRLSSSESRSRTLVESPNLGVVLMGIDGRIHYASPKIEELTGYSPREFFERRRMPWRITHPDDHPVGVRAFKQAAAGTPIPNQEFRLMHKSGTYRWASGSSFPVYDDDGEIRSVQVLIEDITARKQLEEQLRHAQKMEAVGQLSTGIAHNFNNMLQGIQGSVDLAREEPAAEVRSYLEDASAMTKRAAVIVRQLVQFASPGKDHRKIPVDIVAVVASVRQVCFATFDPGVEIKIAVEDRLPSVMGDASQIEQVLLNLCMNARETLVEAGLSGSPIQISAARCSVPAQLPFPPPGSEPGVYVRLEVRDQGTGMSPQIRDRVFEPFFTTREPGKGTGLGLSTAYGIARQHGGWIDCESELGVGTAFRLFLPAGPTPDESNAVTSPVPDMRDTAETIVGGSETILVIDDEERIRRTVSKMLTRCGYAVLLGADGQDGIDTFRRQREIDLVILDLSMPNMPGEEVLRQLRALDAGVRVIIFTGRSTEAEGLPIDGLIQKPVTMDVLTQTVRRILDN